MYKQNTDNERDEHYNSASRKMQKPTTALM